MTQATMGVLKDEKTSQYACRIWQYDLCSSSEEYKYCFLRSQSRPRPPIRKLDGKIIFSAGDHVGTTIPVEYQPPEFVHSLIGHLSGC